ncbi:MAG: PQQ-binding-like beta-propeller repeat protein [Bacteroidota bacterium]|nr:PQQ-binding-like beta-propeller repeat protein [Bacteroidota bacterium]
MPFILSPRSSCHQVLVASLLHPVLLSLPVMLFAPACTSKQKAAPSGWEVAGGTHEGTHYSSATQIDTNNVKDLEVAWTFHTGDADTLNHSQIQCNPIIVNGILYGTSPSLILFAVDAATGKEIWTFSPRDSNQNRTQFDFVMNNSRGVTYWSSGEDKRIFYTAGPFVYAVDALTGMLIASFGQNGRIDLHAGLGRDVHDLYVTSTAPGIVYKDLLIMGSRVSEGADAAPGHIRAYDARTGRQIWIFHTIPQPGEQGYQTWEDSIAWRHIGGANTWSGFTLDEKRGILFAPTGRASFDFYGGRRLGQDLFANCLLALDAATGKRIWHFQTVHHDIWDKDIPTPPALVRIRHNGQIVDAVAQPTKNGFVFLFERETGKPLFPIEEKAVPTNTELKGERLWPAQPVPTLPKPFVRQTFRDSDINTLLPDTSVQEIRSRLAGYRTGNMFNPISEHGTVVLPGLDGGAEWGGPAFDPKTGLLYINANEMAWVITAVRLPVPGTEKQTLLEAGHSLYTRNCISCHGPDRKGSGNNPSLLDVNKKYDETQFTALVSSGRRMMPAFQQLTQQEKEALACFVLDLKNEQQKPFIPVPRPVDTFLNLPYNITGYNRFLSKEGLPAIRPPWGTLNAINLNTGQLEWKIPLGEVPGLSGKGVVTGSENYGGAAVTRGGLLFIAATRDGKFRAFNKRTGKLLWETILPAPGFATPAVYTIEGREYIVIACGGGKLGTHSGDSYVAFALPAR